MQNVGAAGRKGTAGGLGKVSVPILKKKKKNWGHMVKNFTYHVRNSDMILEALGSHWII